MATVSGHGYISIFGGILVEPDASSIALIHLHQVDSVPVGKALQPALAEWKFHRTTIEPVPASGPWDAIRRTEPAAGKLLYLVGPKLGNWVTLIDPFVEKEDAPFLADLANRLSTRMATHSLALLLLQNETLFYNLDYRGSPRDGYCSNPEHLADHELSVEEVNDQRHQPKSFTPLLPKTTTMDALSQLLETGWWADFDRGQLEDEEREFETTLTETDRLNQLGNLLQLTGKVKYNLANWRTNQEMNWKNYTMHFYSAKGRSLSVI